MSYEFEKVLDTSERIIWSGKPKFWPFIAQTLPFVVFGFIWLSIVIGPTVIFAGVAGLMSDFASQMPENGECYINNERVSCAEFEETAGTFIEQSFSGFGLMTVFFSLPFLLVGLGMLSSPIGAALAHKKAAYTFTDKRVLIAKGIIGTDFKMLDYDKIQNLEVNVGLIDKFFNTGSILIFTGEMNESRNSSSPRKDRLAAIENPYEVFKQLKQVSHDIKTDINYPNKLRPEENPGYNTQYSRTDN